MQSRLFLTILVFLCGPAMAAHVLSVGPDQSWFSFSQEKKRSWNKNDEVCVLQKQREIACGVVILSLSDRAVAETTSHYRARTKRRVVKTKRNGVFVNMGWGKLPIRPGFSVELRKEHIAELTPDPPTPRLPPIQTAPPRLVQVIHPPQRAPYEKQGWPKPIRRVTKPKREVRGWPKLSNRADRMLASYQEMRRTEIFESEVKPLWAITGGVHYLFPNLHFQHAVTHSIASGLQGMYLALPTQGGMVQGPGGFLTFHYYSSASFRGLWIQAGAGMYQLRTSKGAVEEKRKSLAFYFTIGGRWVSPTGITFGLGAGLQYLANAGRTSTNVTIPAFIPSLTMDMGITF